MGTYLLGIDVGTGGTRALIIDEKGASSHQLPPITNRSHPRKSAGRSKIPKTGGAPAASQCESSAKANCAATELLASAFPDRCTAPFCSTSRIASCALH